MGFDSLRGGGSRACFCCNAERSGAVGKRVDAKWRRDLHDGNLVHSVWNESHEFGRRNVIHHANIHDAFQQHGGRASRLRSSRIR